MTGLPKSIIKKYGISKKAWSVFRGRRSRSSPRRVRHSSRKIGGRIRTMARRFRRHRSRGSMTIPIAPIAGLAQMFGGTIAQLQNGNVQGAITQLKWDTVGVDAGGNFRGDKLMMNLMPVIVGLLIHKFVGGSPLNLNRTLARAKVPFIRI